MTADKRKVVWDHVKTGVWRFTHPDRLSQVIESGCVLADPQVPERWNQLPFPSYVRQIIGGVSLFQFDKYRNAPWGWDWAIPYPSRMGMGWNSALWLEIDVAVLGDKFIDVDSLETMCQRHCVKTRSISIIDIDVEAACRGSIPASAIISGYVVGEQVDWHEVYSRPPNGMTNIPRPVQLFLG